MTKKAGSYKSVDPLICAAAFVQYALSAQSEETEIWEIFMKQEEGKMELFEEVGQTLSRTGQGLAQKARDTAQVTKLKLAVSEDERAIEGIYLSIGKAYCRMCEACSPEQLPSEATSEPIASLLTSLRERKQQLLDKQQTIRVIQQVMICPKCGASCSAEGSFCTNCGASLQEAKAGVFSCPACGSKLKPGAAFCTQCGKPVR